MSRVQAGHEHAARGCAYRATGIEIGVSDALRGETVDIGRQDLLLPIAAELAVAEIIEDDQNDIRLAEVLRSAKWTECARGCACQKFSAGDHADAFGKCGDSIML